MLPWSAMGAGPEKEVVAQQAAAMGNLCKQVFFFSLFFSACLRCSAQCMLQQWIQSSSSSRSRSRVAGRYGDEVQSGMQCLLAYSAASMSYAFNNVADPCPELTRTAAYDEGVRLCSWVQSTAKRLLVYIDHDKSLASTHLPFLVQN